MHFQSGHYTLLTNTLGYVFMFSYVQKQKGRRIKGKFNSKEN